MSCDCITQVNAAFERREGDNTALAVPIGFNIRTGVETMPRIQISVEKRDPKNRKRPTAIQPKYCPFCGVKYEAET